MQKTTLYRLYIALLSCMIIPLPIYSQAMIDDALIGGEPFKECFVLLTQAELDVSNLHGKEQKGTFVYETLSSHARASQVELVDFLSDLDRPYQSYSVVNGVFTTLTWEEIQTVARFPGVISIVANGRFQQNPPQREVLTLRDDDLTWGLEMVQADSVWAMGIRGEGAVIGGEDSGVKWNIPSIENSYRGNEGDTVDHNYHWHDAIHDINPMHGDSVISPDNNPCGLDVDYPCDDHGHGTHTVGTMVGEDGDTKIGMAPEAKWMACRCMERGYGTLQTYVECFEFFLAPTDLNGENPDPSMSPDVINNSWGCPRMEGCNPTNYHVMEAAVDALTAAGIFVVVSAGNSGSGCSSIANPAAIFENSFSVGASQEDDDITNFSSRGPVTVDGSGRIKPDVVAPGRQVKSQLPDSSYQSWNGTSMAGPHVAGLVALIISANPQLRGEVQTIKEIIRSTAERKFRPQDSCDIDPLAIPNNTFGYGRINAWEAVKKALNTIITSDEKTDIEPIRYNSLVEDWMTIKIPGHHGIESLELLSISGHLLGRWKISDQSEIQVDMRSNPPGMYLLKTTGTHTEGVYKLVRK